MQRINKRRGLCLYAGDKKKLEDTGGSMSHSDAQSGLSPPALTALVEDMGVIWRDDGSDDNESDVSFSGRWALITGTALIAIGWSLAVASKYFTSPWLLYLALAALVVSIASVIYYGFTGGKAILKEVRCLDQDNYGAIGRRMQQRYELAQHIRRTYSAAQIEFAHAYFAATVEQFQVRAGLIVGPLEKIGAIPLLASAIFTFATAVKGNEIPIYWYTGAAIVIMIYLMLMRLMSIAHTIRRIVMVLEQARG